MKSGMWAVPSPECSKVPCVLFREAVVMPWRKESLPKVCKVLQLCLRSGRPWRGAWMGVQEGVVGEKLDGIWWFRNSFGLFCCTVNLKLFPLFHSFWWHFPLPGWTWLVALWLELGDWAWAVPGGHSGLPRGQLRCLGCVPAQQVWGILKVPGQACSRSTDSKLKLGTVSQFVLCFLWMLSWSSVSELACPGFAELLFFKLKQGLCCPTISHCHETVQTEPDKWRASSSFPSVFPVSQGCSSFLSEAEPPVQCLCVNKPEHTFLAGFSFRPMWLLRVMSPEKSWFVARPSPLVLCVPRDLPFARLTFVFQYLPCFDQLLCQWSLLRMKGPLSSHQRELDLEQELSNPTGFSFCTSWASSAPFSRRFCVSLLKANYFQSCLETFIIIVISGTTPLGRECEERGAWECF